jgi:DNA-binding PadR family transcriptional regulator
MTDASSPLTPAVFHVLLTLDAGPLHGYAIMKRVEADSGVVMGPGTVYGSLRRLKEAGWVEDGGSRLDAAESTGAGASEETPGASSDPRRGAAFSLTAAGRDALTREAGRISRLAGMERVRRLALDPGG